MSNETLPVCAKKYTIANDFPKSPCSVFFGNSFNTEDRFPNASEALKGYGINKSVIAKLAIILSADSGLPIGLGGSCLDQLLIESGGRDPNILSKKKEDINKRRIVKSMSSDAGGYNGPVSQAHDSIHSPGNIDLRIQSEDGNMADIILKGAEKVLEDIGESQYTLQTPLKMYRWDKIYQQAWDILQPRDIRRLVYLNRIDDRPLAIIRYLFESEQIGIPANTVLTGTFTLREIMDQLTASPDKYQKTIHEHESLNIICNSAGSLRSASRCFNIDALIGKLSVNRPLVYRGKLREFLEEANVNIELPEIPSKAHISAEAIMHYEAGIDRGDVNVMEQFSEVVIRSLRKSITLQVPEYDEKSLSETKRLMDKMAKRWQGNESQKHSETVIIKNMRELEVCAEFDFKRTAEMIEKLGIKQIFDLNWERYCQIESESIDMSHMAKLLGKSFYRHALG